MALCCALEDLIECVHYRLLLCLDESALGTLGLSCRSLADVAKEQALWKRLAICRNRLAAGRFLGLLSWEAGQTVTTEDPRPLPGVQQDCQVDWRDVCRQLNNRTAERPWEYEPTADFSSALWTELSDEFQLTEEAPRADDLGRVPTSKLFASQSSHLLWIGGNRLLAFAGGYSPDVVGGAALHPLREVYLLELPSISDAAHSSFTRPDLSATRLDCGTADSRLPWGHPSMNGAASDFDPVRKVAYFFGGGAPHSDVNNATSALQLHGWETGHASSADPHASENAQAPSARWEVVNTPGSVEAGQVPAARQGLRGTVFDDEFIIFGGRQLGGVCTNDVWSLDLVQASSSSQGSSLCTPWRQLECEGQSPSPRVWYAASHAVHGQWFIFGGSTWQFEEPEEPHDFRVMFVLDLAERRWSSFDPSPGPQPPWAVAGVMVPLGCCQLLLLGGTLPHEVGADGIHAQSLRRWRNWYNRLDEPYVFDLGTKTWSERRASVAAPGDVATQEEREQHVADVYLRSHFSATFVPHRRSVIVFGGSRYFTGEYFNDVLELQLPASERASRPDSVLGIGRQEAARHPVCGSFQAPDALPRHLQRNPRGMTPSRGFLGRMRGMVRDRIISEAEFNQAFRNLD
eukprot:TRINITY_DN45240_c0_g1_i1.p1 TRINITY_DN45240_c0_g1~~TRINITY_DN45240_c0_g1_i1.p1  ORF type:complete len:631 (-),score=82.80 TRINITY_DN45240_c0_g1_i1:84-1976(-)